MATHADSRLGGVPAVPPVARAAAAQSLAWVATLSLGVEGAPALAAHSAIAGIAGGILGLPWWWFPINLAFAPAVNAAASFHLPPLAFLTAFIALVLVYWTSCRTRVPLYLSGKPACRALSQLLPRDRPFRFLDAGCGIGTTLAWLSPRHLSGSFEGVEIAPLPALAGWLRAHLSGGLFAVRRADLWKLPFSRYDVVYAFLSPVPMDALWRKVRAEMKPGSLFVSNTFLSDGPEPDLSIALPGRGRALHAWRL